MTTQQVSVPLLKAQLDQALDLNLDDFALEENAQKEYTARFVGITLQSEFQAIYDISKGNLHGFEAILKPSLGDIQPTTAEFAYSYAKATGKLVKFDRLCRTLHVINYHHVFQQKGLLFLTVDPDLLISVNEHGKVFERILHEHALPTERVVIQIRDYHTTEQHENLASYERQLNAAMHNYHERGYKIAVDCFGNKHSLIPRLWKLAPDYIKFDPRLIQEAEDNARLKHTMQHLTALAHDLGASTVVTGVETASQFAVATEIGVHLLQGSYLAAPVSTPTLKTSELIQGRVSF